MRNLEIKARYPNHKNLVRLLKELGAEKIENMHQVDTYFNVSRGRLKLRELSKTKVYLIYYERGDKTTERWSNFYTCDIPNQKEFKNFWKRALGIKVVVDKKRTLYMYRNARIHVDTVKKLGTFIEIEVQVKKGNLQAKNLMKELLNHLKIPKTDFITKSYSDLL